MKQAQKQRQLLATELQAALIRGKKLFASYLAKTGQKKPKTEQDAYALIKND